VKEIEGHRKPVWAHQRLHFVFHCPFRGNFFPLEVEWSNFVQFFFMLCTKSPKSGGALCASELVEEREEAFPVDEEKEGLHQFQARGFGIAVQHY